VERAHLSCYVNTKLYLIVKDKKGWGHWSTEETGELEVIAGVLPVIRPIAGINLLSCERWLYKSGHAERQYSFMQEGTDDQLSWWYRTKVNVYRNVFILHMGLQLLNNC
jgi:hypothetical protein